MELWQPGARVLVHTAGGVVAHAPPDTHVFSGTIAGAPGSGVVLTVDAEGGIAGLATRGGSTWAVTKAAAGPQAAAATPNGPAPGGISSVAGTKSGRRRHSCGMKSHRAPTVASPVANVKAVQVGCWAELCARGSVSPSCIA